MHGPNPARSYSARLARPAERPTGPRPDGPVQSWSGPHGHAIERAGRAGAWSPRAARAWDDAVVWFLRGRWWLASGKVVLASSRGPPGGRWATGVEAGLTEGSGRLQGGGGVSVRWRAMGSSLEGGSAATPASSWSYEGR
jgi:hypothetical protein